MPHQDLTPGEKRFWKLVFPDIESPNPLVQALAGEFLLAHVAAERGSHWALFFPARGGFSAWHLMLQRRPDGAYALRVSLEGKSPGPVWTAEVRESLDEISHPIVASLVASSEGAGWPEALELSLLAAGRQQRFEIPAAPRTLSSNALLFDPLPSGMTLCDCVGCGVEKWELTITGIEDAFCTDCEPFNVPTGATKAYLVRSADDCTFRYEFVDPVCGGNAAAILTLEVQDDCTIDLHLGLEVVGDSPGWTKHGVPFGDCLQEHVLNEYVPPPGSFELCQWENALVSIKPVFPDEPNGYETFAGYTTSWRRAGCRSRSRILQTVIDIRIQRPA